MRLIRPRIQHIGTPYYRCIAARDKGASHVAGVSVSGRSGTRTPLAAWRALVLAILTLFAWQSVLLQSHVHAAGVRPAQSAAASPVAATLPGVRAGSDRRDDPADCPICREVAHAGHYLTPSPAAVPAPAPLPTWVSVARTGPADAPRRSSGWRNRDPPGNLHDL